MAAEPFDHSEATYPELVRGLPRERPRPAVSRAALLLGSPVSRGKARGRARLLRSPVDVARVQPGDVVVVEAASPAWTAALHVAAAIVTDSGGALSNLAEVAREYGLPAVVGTGLATVVIRDGQVVDVDGGTGIVQVVAPAFGCASRTSAGGALPGRATRREPGAEQEDVVLAQFPATGAYRRAL